MAAATPTPMDELPAVASARVVASMVLPLAMSLALDRRHGCRPRCASAVADESAMDAPAREPDVRTGTGDPHE